jgi:hypothetical protein
MKKAEPPTIASAVSVIVSFFIPGRRFRSCPFGNAA